MVGDGGELCGFGRVVAKAEGGHELDEGREGSHGARDGEGEREVARGEGRPVGDNLGQ